jgi:hypothetical protein
MATTLPRDFSDAQDSTGRSIGVVDVHCDPAHSRDATFRDPLWRHPVAV